MRTAKKPPRDKKRRAASKNRGTSGGSHAEEDQRELRRVNVCLGYVKASPKEPKTM